mgnify:CR=1 FL=1|tara:strand:- start:1271 stop:1447 length:177 start_codon:yes stop_codon:yes gene_type:complete
MACNNCKSKEGSMTEKFKKAGEQLPENWKRTLLITVLVLIFTIYGIVSLYYDFIGWVW